MDYSHAKFYSSRALNCLLLSIILLLLAGCQPGSSEPDSSEEDVVIEVTPPDPLTLLIIDAPELGSQIKRQWRARRDGELTVLNQTTAKWTEADYQIDADVVLYPPGMMAELVNKSRLLSVPDDVWNSDELGRRDLLKRVRRTLIEFDNQIWAVPLANPQWMLLYRSDLLEQLKIVVPQTWPEWVEAVKAIRTADLPVAVEERTVLPLAENWAAHTFLLRCASTIRQRGKLSTVFDRSNMKPLIDREPFVEALDELQELFSEQEQTITPAQAWTKLLQSKSVMTIAWPMNLLDETPIDNDVAESISVAPVPGSSKWFDLQSEEWSNRDSPQEQRSVDYLGFGGLVGSVSSETRHASSAFEFLQWLCSRSISSDVLGGSQQSGPFRRSQLKSISRWAGSQLSPSATESMANTIQAAHSNPVALLFPRVPGYDDYIRSLDRQVRECLAKNSSARQALRSAAEEWEAITDRIGRTEQTANLRRSNGL
jgi:ABC-type glycerol-3-phosphate transport system substrate-binding protein